MAEEQTYLDPADYPFADFRDPPVQVVDYQEEYGAGQSLAMKELVEIANRLGYILTLQVMRVQQVDFTGLSVEEGLDQLWGSAGESLLEFFMPPSFKGAWDGGPLFGWVFDSPPSGGWQSEDVPEQWRISIFDQVWPSLVKTAWETDDYVHSATYEHDVKGERGIKCFNEGSVLGYDIFYQDEFAGSIDLHNLSDTNRSCEIGYWLDKNHTGKGIITRAQEHKRVLADKEHGRRQLGVGRDI